MDNFFENKILNDDIRLIAESNLDFSIFKNYN